jgi:hypothetical protein
MSKKCMPKIVKRFDFPPPHLSYISYPQLILPSIKGYISAYKKKIPQPKRSGKN